MGRRKRILQTFRLRNRDVHLEVPDCLFQSTVEVGLVFPGKSLAFSTPSFCLNAPALRTPKSRRLRTTMSHYNPLRGNFQPFRRVLFNFFYVTPLLLKEFRFYKFFNWKNALEEKMTITIKKRPDALHGRAFFIWASRVGLKRKSREIRTARRSFCSGG